MFKNMKIGVRLGLGFGVVLMLFLVGLALFWGWIAGLGGFFMQMWDYNFRNALLHDKAQSRAREDDALQAGGNRRGQPFGRRDLSRVDREDPLHLVGDDEVLIAVKACGVNYADGIIRMGLYASAKELHGYPITPGFELAGVVTAVGAKVTEIGRAHV